MECPLDNTVCPSLSFAEAFRRFEHEAVPGEMDTGRYRCSYYSWGRGPALVFVHGLCDSARSFVLPIAHLVANFRCIAYDLPRGVKHYRHDDFVFDLCALLDHLGIEQSFLLGSSFGSTIVLAALHARPGRFPRAVLAGGFARRRMAVAEVLLARFARYWPWSMRRLPWFGATLRRSHEAPFAGREPQLLQFFVERQGDPPMAAVARRALIMHDLDLRPILPQIEQPILVVCGEADPLVPKSCEAELLDGLPKVSRVEIPGCGHFPQFSHAGELAEIVELFLMGRLE
jgi:3-oxoadipate enol-lactonase